MAKETKVAKTTIDARVRAIAESGKGKGMPNWFNLPQNKEKRVLHIDICKKLVELSNANALLRIRSRMVSSTFIILSCTACFLFPQLSGSIVQLAFIGMFLFLFRTYQDPQATGLSFYAFACIGIASMVFIHILWYVPVLWIVMATQLQSLSWRTWLASLIGLLAPYWFALAWFLMPSLPLDDEWTIDLQPLGEHFAQLAQFMPVLSDLSLGRIFSFVFLLIMSAIGIIHFWNYSFEDKIRIRLLYGLLTTLTILTLCFIIAQPQHFDVLIRVAFVCASPLIAHVLTFTNSRLSNILFFVAIGTAVLITIYNLVVLLNSNLAPSSTWMHL